MGQGISNPEDEHRELEKGVKTVILVHGLASCALRAHYDAGATGYLCDHVGCAAEDEERLRLLYVSIGELTKRPHIVKSLACSWEETVSKDHVRTFKTVDGYEGMHVRPVEGLSGIRSLNPGEDLTPVYLWHQIIKHLDEKSYNIQAFNYDWRRWGDVIYVEMMLKEFQHCIEHAVRIARQPVVLVGHSLGTQVVTYFMGALGPAWTQAHITDAVLVGPATMGSPSVFAAYANGPSTIAHSSVVPVASIYETRLRDVASTWPGLLAVMPTKLGPVDVFDGEMMASCHEKRYGTNNIVDFLEDLKKCDEAAARVILFESEKYSIHEKTRKWLEEHNWVGVERTWVQQFENAAVMRSAFERHVAPYLLPPACRVHVIYSTGIPTPSFTTFSRNLYQKAQLSSTDRGDDTILAKSVERMCEAWRNAGCIVKVANAGKLHHKELIQCPLTMHVMDHVMAMDDADGSDYSSLTEEDAWCAG